MAFVEVPDRAAGYALQESDWDLWADNMNAATWVKLADETLTGTAAAIDFTSISGSWAHLMIVAYLRGDVASTATEVRVQLNGDTGSNYDWQRLLASASTPSAGEGFGQSSAFVGSIPGASAGSGEFAALRCLLPGYSQTIGHKVLTSRWSLKTGTSSGNLQGGAAAAFWRSTAAVTRVKILPASNSLVAGSKATLYAMAG